MKTEVKTATDAVRALLDEVDMEAWGSHNTGNYEVDRKRVETSIATFIRQGCTGRYPLETKGESDIVGRLAYEMAHAALQFVDWPTIMALWGITQTEKSPEPDSTAGTK